MAYFSPYIDETGLHLPTYSDIRDQLISDAKNIFGQDIYLEIDSQDYQWISSVAEKIYDSFQLLQQVYNSRSPQTSVGVALDSMVKLNGLSRKSGTPSTCLVTITGTAGTIINNGAVADINYNKWNLPTSVTIPVGGIIDVTATCQTEGTIVANIGDITTITTPTYATTSVYNLVAAVVGTNQETDSELRARQSVSTSILSKTLLEGTKATLLAVSNVTRLAVYENDTNSTDSDGLPAHSITCVVEGGTDTDVATAIYLNKGIGAYTNGDQEITITDSFGQDTVIRFYRPTYKSIDVVVNVKALTGYTTDITAQIKQNLVDYLNGMQIGDNLSISSLWGISLTAMPDLKTPMFSITSLTAGLHGGSQGTSDIVISYKEVTQGVLANITVNVT